jgi:hypothetical protein
MTIMESWQYTAKSVYENITYNGSWNSPQRDFSYELRTPYVVDAGVAFTFGGAALLSVDYELMDYSVMNYRDVNDGFFGDNAWDSTNQCNRLFCGVSHSLRAGVEFRPTPEVSLRAGYSLVTDPERYAYDDDGTIVTAETWVPYDHMNLKEFHYFKNNTHAFSLGAGYSSSGAFFADAAVRLTGYPGLHYSPYYYGGYEAADKNGNFAYYGAPDIFFNRSIVDVLLTIGWRF